MAADFLMAENEALAGAHIPGAQVRLFGSRARGNASSDSDIDL